MARPTKQGIDYFPVDCQFDTKIEMYLVETEANGLAVLISLWQLIYSNEGYFINNDDDLCLLIKKRINIDINLISNCIDVALKREIFNSNLNKKYKILTSKAIQKRFFEIAKRKKIIQYNVKYIINGINVSENCINVDNNTTKGKVKVKVKVKEQYAEFVTLTEKEYNTCIEKYGEIKTKKAIKKLNDYKQSNGKKYKSDYGALNTWVWDSFKEDEPKGRAPIKYTPPIKKSKPSGEAVERIHKILTKTGKKLSMNEKIKGGQND